jgi:two-component system, cell cycle sensor histidine kinase and response regulator CckA
VQPRDLLRFTAHPRRGWSPGNRGCPRHECLKFHARTPDIGEVSSEHTATAELLFRSVCDMVCTLDLEGRFTWVNAAGEALTGRSAAELLGRPAVEVIAPELRAQAVEQFARRLQDLSGHGSDESMLQRKDGTQVPIEITSVVIAGPDGPAAVLGLVRDLSARRGTEEALRQSEERFRSAFQYAPIGMSVVDTEGRFLQVNGALCDMVGYTAEELLAMSFQDITHPEDVDFDVQTMHMVLGGEATSYQMEKRYFHRDGHVVWVLLSASLVRASDGTPVHFVSQVQDITEQKRAHEAVALSAARLAEAQHLAALGSWEWDLDTGATVWSTEQRRIFGVDPALELDRDSFLARVHPEDRSAVEGAIGQALQGESTDVLEYRIVRDDGTVRWIQGRREAVVEGGRVVRLRGICQDVTDRKRAEARLLEAERRFRTLIEQLPLCTYIRPIDLTRPNQYVSPQVEAILGYPREEWESDADLLARIVHPDDRERVLADARRLRETGEPVLAEYRYRRPDGTVVWVQDETYLVTGEDGEPCVQGYLLDITERKRAEEERDRLAYELHHAQKLEAIGQLAGGIAHDFNNTLTAIRGYSELLAANLPDEGTLRRYAEEIRKTAEAGAALPKQLLAFGRKQPLDVAPLDLNETLADSCELLRPLLGDDVELIWLPGPDAVVVGDRAQLGQAMLNLALNARDAMPDRGSLVVATRRERVDAELAEPHQAEPGEYAVVVVRDSGTGMDEETRQRAFEPFFTTKESGTGLGLATVYGIVRQSGGFVVLDSAPGKGTTFQIYLPCGAAAAEPPSEEPTAGTILVAEDEDTVRGLVCEVLELGGYTVHAAANGVEALDVFERAGGEIDALVTDVKMPGMNGLELVRHLRAERPDLPAVAISAYGEQPAEDEDISLLRKPFSSLELVERVDAAVRDGARREPEPEISLLVADDHPPVLESVARYLETKGFRVVGTAPDGKSALRRIVDRRPSVALVDIRMSGLSGVEVTRRAAQLAPSTAVVLYTGQADRELLGQALDAGARGFLLKDATLDEVAAVLREVAAGSVHVDAALADGLVAPEALAELPALTAREQEVLKLLAEGKTNDGAAAELGISAETVQSHVRKAMSKLQADTRTAAVATALRLALIA